MDKAQLEANNWKIEKRFHEEEAYWYYTAEKGRNILTSDDGNIFGGLLNGVWV